MTIESLRSLCAWAIPVLTAEPNVLNLTCEAGNIADEWVVVGDIHGQFNDLVYHVLGQQRNNPGDKKFLFLGDYVDRGPQGIDVITILLCLKVAYPDRVFLLRGNHEEATTCRTYGFFYECRTKFGDTKIWNDFNDVFSAIPLAALLQCGAHKVFFLHGGLSPGLAMVEGINFVQRTEYGGNLDDSSSEIVDGLLWSDPSDIRGFLHNDRGCGFAFGENTSEEFCYRNGLDFMCRAHQMMMAGYQWTHSNRVLTLFSAPNYCGLSNNKGAILVINGLWEPRFVQYEVAPPPGSPAEVDTSKLPQDYFNNASPPSS
jgi:serine/threonine-protein phosphatase 2A catalytic subunit